MFIKGLAVGIGVVLFIAIATRDITLINRYATYFGLGCWLLSGVFSGAFVSGHQNRANFSTETKEDRKERQSLTLACFYAGIPGILVAVAIYLITK
ncbi:DUF5316 domain-containing protein [Metallumcola ferriviriculae]|uniref:DUF5316 domain-containing protein n=1 Tax=Metallumcola ferriviriculae TaxID=3039180 RepID=A0AAU0UT49_9FIRM|nr:DUF5316 domain-containing protein [Desulfitibacteraceae bacterium MK1]